MLRYLGWYDAPGEPQGLILMQAHHGSLQRYLDENFNSTSPSVLRKWCIQATESTAYIHRHGVMHSDMCPENFLIHATTPNSPDLWLCDFGGLACEKLGVDGGHLPDPSFSHSKTELSSAKTDIFSLASVIYTILTGHWLHKNAGEEMKDYDSNVDELFGRGEFLGTAELFEDKLIMKC